MPKYNKGESGNPDGRPAGAKNKKTKQWDKFSEWFMSKGMQKLEKEMDKLEGKDYITTCKDLIEYFQPKLARTEIAGDQDQPLTIKMYLKGEDQEDILNNL